MQIAIKTIKHLTPNTLSRPLTQADKGNRWPVLRAGSRILTGISQIASLAATIAGLLR